MFGAIGSFVGKMLGSDKAIEKGIDTISNGLDKLVYTDEEKAEDGAKERALARQSLVKWLDATQGQNLARRLLALIVTATWLLMYLATTGLAIAGIWLTDSAAQLKAAADVIGDRATEMNGAMMLILGFYFAAPHLGSIVGVAMNKFGGAKKK